MSVVIYMQFGFSAWRTTPI